MRYIKSLKKHEPTSSDAKDLHILDAKNRIKYKLMVLIWKTIHLRQPKMLAEIIEPVEGNDKLRSGKDINRAKTPNGIPTNITKRRFAHASSSFNELPKTSATLMI